MKSILVSGFPLPVSGTNYPISRKTIRHFTTAPIATYPSSFLSAAVMDITLVLFERRKVGFAACLAQSSVMAELTIAVYREADYDTGVSFSLEESSSR